MKKTILLLSLLFLGAHLIIANNSDYQHEKDSFMRAMSALEGEEYLKAYKQFTLLISYNETEVDTLIYHYDILIKKLDEANDLKTGLALRYNLLSMFNNHNAHEKMLERAPDFLEFMSAHEDWSSYMECYNIYVMAYFHLGQKEKAIEEAQLFFEKNKELDHPESAYPLYTLGMLYRHAERDQEGLACLKEALERASRYKEVTSLKISLYPALVETLLLRLNNETGNADINEVLEYMKLWETDIETYTATNPHMASAEKTNFHLQNIKLALLQNDCDKAEYYCNLIEEAGLQGNTVLKYIYISRRDIAIARKDWKEALKYAELQYELSKEEGHLQNMWADAEQKAVILFHLHETKQGMQTLNAATMLRDSIHNKEIHAKIDELHTIYKVDILTAEKERNRLFFISAAIVCILLLVILLVIIRYNRRLRAKNHRLYQQIQDSLRRDKQAVQALATAPAETLTREADLYRRLTELMQAERLFIRPDIERKQLADRLGTNERYLSDAINQEAGETVSAYIARLRLQYALELLEAHPELTLEAVATESGHASYSPFYRAFGKMYGMSPSEYRKLSAKKEI